MNRLAAYRYLEGLNQAELASRLGVPPQRISEIERGYRAPTFDLSQLDYSPDRLNTVPDMTEPLHRHYTRTSEAAKKRAKEIVRLGGEVFAELRSGTRLSVRLEREVSSVERDIDDIEELAAEVRQVVLDVEEVGPIRNLTSAVERAGVAVVPIREFAGPEGAQTIDGLSSWVEGQPTIGLDPDVPGERFRFSLAHELGHLVMHARKHSYTEDEANRFAGTLLVPRSTIEFALRDARLPTLSDFLQLKETLGVSVAALIYRARDLDIISAERFRSLQIQKSTTWGRKREPNDSRVMTPGLLRKMIDIRGGTEAVATELGVPPSHLEQLVAWAPPPRLRLV